MTPRTHLVCQLAPLRLRVPFLFRLLVSRMMTRPPSLSLILDARPLVSFLHSPFVYQIVLSQHLRVPFRHRLRVPLSLGI